MARKYIPNSVRSEATLEKLREQRREYQRKFRETHPGYSAKKRREWYKANPDKAKEANRRSNLGRYGLTGTQYDEMVKTQNGLCAICDKPQKSRRSDRLFVDHNHVTNANRKLLCHSCNVAIGHAREKSDLLKKMIAYLGAE